MWVHLWALVEHISRQFLLRNNKSMRKKNNTGVFGMPLTSHYIVGKISLGTNAHSYSRSCASSTSISLPIIPSVSLPFLLLSSLPSPSFIFKGMRITYLHPLSTIPLVFFPFLFHHSLPPLSLPPPSFIFRVMHIIYRSTLYNKNLHHEIFI